MGKKIKIESVISTTNEIHEAIADIYEAIADGEIKDGVKKIDKAIYLLREFKLDLTKGDE